MYTIILSAINTFALNKYIIRLSKLDLDAVEVQFTLSSNIPLIRYDFLFLFSYIINVRIKSGQTMATDSKAAHLIPLFLGKRSQNIAFVLDTSEAMSAVLGSVKRLLIQTLLTKASLRDSMFNIMTFSYKVMWDLWLRTASL